MASRGGALPMAEPGLAQRRAAAGGPRSRLARSTLRVAASGAGPAADVVVCGGGAAGLTAAFFAASLGARVTVLEKTEEAGKKILISGGTRCNVLPATADADADFYTESPPAALRALLRTWTLPECRAWLEGDVGLELALEEETQKLFPASNSAAEVRDRLVAACRRQGVAFQFGSALRGLRRSDDHSGGGWDCLLSSGAACSARRVVLATGGLSFPKLTGGADGVGYSIAAAHGHALHAPYPALTPLLGGHPGGGQLAGISLYSVALEVEAAPGGAGGAAAGGGGKKGKKGKAQRARRSALLLTHRGYSGPAALDLSHHAVMALERGGAPPALRVQWTGEERGVWEERLAGGAAMVGSTLRRHGIPARLADALCDEAGVPKDRKLSEMRREERAGLLASLSEYVLPVTGHEGYPKAEVTGGGVPLSEVDCRSMESARMPGVHLAGEVLDAHGRIGGFNFWLAWCSGRAAGLAAGAAAQAAAGEGCSSSCL